MSKKKKYILIITAVLILGVLILCGKDIYTIANLLIKNDLQTLQQYLHEIRIKSFIVIGFFQFAQIVLAVLPSEFVQIAAFLSFGPIVGFLVIYCAVVLGSAVVYFVVRYGKNIEKHSEYEEKVNEIEKKYEKNSITMNVLLMYFLPAIPYGMISYYAANKKISFHRYLIITMIGVIPSILLTLIGTGLVKYWYFSGSIIAVLIVLIVILLIAMLTTYLKRLDNLYKNNLYRKPNFILFYLLRGPLYLFFKLRYKLHIDVCETKNKKGPYIMLSTHQSAYDFLFASIAMGNHRFNTIAARYYFYNKWLRRLLTALGAFPKDLFNQDVSAIKSIINTINHGQRLLMMPEGRLSTVGYNEEIVFSCAKLVKKLNVDVCGVRTSGAYYALGKGFKNNNIGRIDIESFVILTKEEVKDLSLEEIDRRISNALVYDDAKFMDDHPELEYKNLPDLSRIPGLIYYCPNCQSEASFSCQNGKVVCSHCHLELTLNKRYNLMENQEKYKYPTLKDIHLHDLELIREKVRDDNFEITTEVVLRSAHGKNNKIIPVGRGIITFNKDLFTYQGTLHEEDVKLEFSAKSLRAIPFAISDSFEIYRDGEFYAFNPVNNPLETIRWVMYMEENYNLRYKNER